MELLEAQIDKAAGVIERVRQEEEARSELIDLADVVEEDRYRSLRTELRDVEQLAEKIELRGQLVPILVWLRRGKYVLLSGHRRVAALRRLGAETAKAIVYGDRDLTPQDALDIAIDDNIDRESFSRAEIAALVARLVGEGMTQRAIAKRLRLATGTVSDYYRLHGAPEDVRRAVDAGRVALRAGLRLATEPPAARAAVLGAAGEAGMLSLGDVERLLADQAPELPETRARRGAAWSRPRPLLAHLAWERSRTGEREVRVRIPESLTADQRVALRRLLLDLVRAM